MLTFWSPQIFVLVISIHDLRFFYILIEYKDDDDGQFVQSSIQFKDKSQTIVQSWDKVCVRNLTAKAKTHWSLSIIHWTGLSN